MKSLSYLVLAATAALAACASADDHREGAASADAIERGKQIAAVQCGSCHAIDETSKSVHPLAPPLRTLAPRMDSLDVAFALGMHVGYGDMPSFKIQRDEFRDLTAYINKIHAAK